MHLHSAPVGIVGGNFPIVHHRIVQHGKGMGAAPPTGSVGGIPAVGCPAIPLVFLQPVKIAHVLGESYRLENAHVFSAGKHVGPVNNGVDANHGTGHKLLLIQLAVRQLHVERCDKIPPDEGFVGNLWDLAHRDFRKIDNIEMPFQELLAGFLGRRAVVKNMKSI